MSNLRENPFPGMNPYLEEHWADVHPRMLIYISSQLQRILPAGLKARVEQELIVGETSARPDAVADVGVWSKPANAGMESVGVLERPQAAAPLRVEVTPRPRRHLAITDERGCLVTVIEVLSPSNKRGRDSASCARKGENFISAGVNLVEIDLIRRGGLALLLFDNEGFAELAGWKKLPPYLVSVYRDTDPYARELYANQFAERLPVIAVPLRPDDADALLDIQAIIDQCYIEGAYFDTDYHKEPAPPLEKEDRAWLDNILRSKDCARV